MPFFSSARTSLALRARTARSRWSNKQFSSPPLFFFSFLSSFSFFSLPFLGRRVLQKVKKCLKTPFAAKSQCCSAPQAIFGYPKYWFHCGRPLVGIMKYDFFVLPALFPAKFYLFSVAGENFGYFECELHSRTPLVAITKSYCSIFFTPYPEFRPSGQNFGKRIFTRSIFLALRAKIFFLASRLVVLASSCASPAWSSLNDLKASFTEIFLLTIGRNSLDLSVLKVLTT